MEFSLRCISEGVTSEQKKPLPTKLFGQFRLSATSHILIRIIHIEDRRFNYFIIFLNSVKSDDIALIRQNESQSMINKFLSKNYKCEPLMQLSTNKIKWSFSDLSVSNEIKYCNNMKNYQDFLLQKYLVLQSLHASKHSVY